MSNFTQKMRITPLCCGARRARCRRSLAAPQVIGNARDGDLGKPDKRQHGQRTGVVSRCHRSSAEPSCVELAKRRNVRREARGRLARAADSERAIVQSEPDEVRFASVTDCFGKGIKKARGQAPRLVMLSLLLRSFATGGSRLLRRRLLRGGGLALRWFLPLRYCHDVPPSGWLAVNSL